MSELADYYRERAAEYDAVYAKPERQDDLARLRALLPPLVDGTFWLATVRRRGSGPPE